MSPRRVPSKTQPAPRIDTLRITRGSLGPVSPCTLRIHPLTVFVGPQGTGKSLVAQVLYALEELPFLAQYVRSQDRKKLHPTRLFREVVDRLRSADRAFAGFAGGTTNIKWNRGEEWEVAGRSEFAFAMYKATSGTRPTKASQEIVDALASPGVRPKHHAVFIPTERMVISQLRRPLADRVLSLPITYELYADWIELASGTHGSVVDPRASLIGRLSDEALSGRAKRRGDQWKWYFPKGGGASRARGTLDLDMASSGQRANWSLGYLAQALFDLRQRRDFARVLTVFVEEPELHLHPAAQVKMSQILAVLVNAGFRVVVTTHSLSIVYSLNNLLLARKRFQVSPGRGLPDPAMRLRVEDVAVYNFSDGVPGDVVDRGEAFIDEHELGDVGARLGEEMNALLNRRLPE